MMFVSYSRDEILATRELVKKLSSEGIECWFDESNIPVGQAFVEHLGVGLREADCYLFVDTLASRASYWVTRELQTALRYRRDGRYHSAIRLYTAECKHIDTSDWDVSVLLNEDAPLQIAKLVNSRRTAHLAPNFITESVDVTFLSKSGLGQPNNWTGRQDEFRLLDEWWWRGLPGGWLSGLGGSGKSGLLQTWITAFSCLGYGEPVSANVLYFRGSEIDAIEAQHALNIWEMNNASPQKLLLLVDGYDEARNTQEVDDFLANTIHKSVRTVVTSRTSVPPLFLEGFTNIRIGNMTSRDNIAMLNELGISEPERVELAEGLDNHPLALLLLSKSLLNGNKSAIDLLNDLRSMRRDVSVGVACISPLIQAALMSLTSDARTLLVKLCRDGDDTSAPSELQNQKIRELVKVGLVQIDNLEKVSIHPLVRGYINEEQNLTGHHRP